MKLIIFILILVGCSSEPKMKEKPLSKQNLEAFYGIVYTDSTADILSSLGKDAESIRELQSEIELCEETVVWNHKRIKFKKNRMRIQTKRILIKVKKRDR